MATALAATVLAPPARTPGAGTPGQAPGDAGALFALLLGGILPITPGASGGQPPASQGGQVAALSPRPSSPPLAPSFEDSSERRPAMPTHPAEADLSPHPVQASMPPPPAEQAAPAVTQPETSGGSSKQAEAGRILEVAPSPQPPLQSAGLSGTASPVDADGQTLPAFETAPRAGPGMGSSTTPSAVALHDALDAGKDGMAATASPKATPASRPSAPASDRTDPIAEAVRSSAPAADPAVGRGDPDRSQAPSLRPAPTQLRAQAPIWAAAGMQPDRISQTGDDPAGDGRGVASIDGVDLLAGRPERGSLDLPARTPVATPALQIAHQIVRAAHQRVERMVVQLEPAELGRVEVRLDFGHEGKMSALIATDRPDALDLLQRDARALERSLEQAGLRLDSGGLSFALKRDGGHGQTSSGAPWSELPGDAGSPKAGADQDAPHGRPAMLSLRLLDLQV
jgi:flagellar hook-length control protein FliK